MIFLRRISAVAALIALGASLPVRAQGRAVTIFVYGGGYSALRDLNSAGTVGVGVAYRVRKSGWSLFVQGVGFFYSLTGMTTPTFTRFNRAQVDAAWTAGAAYRVGL